MQIKLASLISAMGALSRLASSPLPTRQLNWNLKRTMESARKTIEDFQAEEKELIVSFGGEVLPTGAVKFPETMDAVAFNRAHNELLTVEAEVWCTPLAFESLPETITAADLMALDGFYTDPVEVEVDAPQPASIAAAG